MATKYCVVKFYDKSKPHRYICVPVSWVKTRRATDNIVGVVYPNEDIRTTEQRVLNNETPEDIWEEHCCEELFTTDEYGEAKLEAMIQNFNYAKENPVGPIAEKRKSSVTMVKEPTSCKKKLFDEKFIIPKKDPYTKANIQKIQNPMPEILELENNDHIYEFVAFLEHIQRTVSDMLTKLKSEKHTFSYIDKEAKTIINAPPEYDENCTRWTLKYRNPGSGLQELVLGSQVYIRKDQVISISKAESYSELISVLLENIFSENALSLCTLERTKKRLDKDAVNVMLEYVTSFGKFRRWRSVSIIDLKECIRGVLQSFRKNILNKTKRLSDTFV